MTKSLDLALRKSDFEPLDITIHCDICGCEWVDSLSPIAAQLALGSNSLWCPGCANKDRRYFDLEYPVPLPVAETFEIINDGLGCRASFAILRFVPPWLEIEAMSLPERR
jgi:hypothetical protein